MVGIIPAACAGRTACVCVAIVAIMFAGCRRQDHSESAPSAGREAPGAAEAAAGKPWFENAAAAANVDFVHSSGQSGKRYFPECIIGGAALFDYDNDGDLDLYCVQGNDLERPNRPDLQNKLFRNGGAGTFDDVTFSAGVGDTGYGVGCTAGDYNGDGHVDLYVTNLGPNVLYRNNGDGTFTDVTKLAGVGDPSWGTSCAFVDYDGDGMLDLFVANYINWSLEQELRCYAPSGELDYCNPTSYKAPARAILYHNLGDGRFADVTVTAGLDKAFGNGLGVACADYNGDGHVDIYVANDGTPNLLWVNSGNGTFTEEGLFAGCAVSGQGMAEAGMGVSPVDAGADGDFDLFVTNLRGETNTFYLNNDGMFEDNTAVLGLGAPSLPYTGFGLGFVDFDHDGQLDLYIANGKVSLGETAERPDDPYAETNLLFRGREGRFEVVTPKGGTAEPLVDASRGAAFGDLDNDGDVDIMVMNKDAPTYVLRNIVDKKGHWVMFRVVHEDGRDAVGSVVRVDAGEQRRWRLVDPAYSYCCANDSRVHFGLGDADRVDGVTVRWPGGVEEHFGPFDADALYLLRRGAGSQ